MVLVVGCYRPAQQVECTLACEQSTECPSGFECDLDSLQCAPEGRSCRTPSDAANDAPLDVPVEQTDAPVGCPAGYITIAGQTSKYRFVSGGVPWLDAATDCANDAATTHLLVLSNELERSAVGAANNGITRWIGLSDRLTDGTYLAVTDETTGGYPDAAVWDGGVVPMDPNLNCVRFEVGSQAEIEIANCTGDVGFICECDALANDPTNY
jgi:hypothetical protein